MENTLWDIDINETVIIILVKEISRVKVGYYPVLITFQVSKFIGQNKHLSLMSFTTINAIMHREKETRRPFVCSFGYSSLKDTITIMFKLLFTNQQLKEHCRHWHIDLPVGL